MSVPELTIHGFHRMFPDNETCLRYLFQTHHAEKICPKCGEKGKYYLQRGTSHFVCRCGGDQISPKARTIFEKSDTDLVKWFYAMFLLSQSGKRVSAMELKRQLHLTYKTAWRMAKQIRLLMLEEPWLTERDVKIDDTHLGGRRPGNRRLDTADRSIMPRPNRQRGSARSLESILQRKLFEQERLLREIEVLRGAIKIIKEAVPSDDAASLPDTSSQITQSNDFPQQ